MAYKVIRHKGIKIESNDKERRKDNQINESFTTIIKKIIISTMKITESQYCYISCFDEKSHQTFIYASSRNQIRDEDSVFLRSIFNGYKSLWKWIIENLTKVKKKTDTQQIKTILNQKQPIPVDRFLTLPVVFKKTLYGQIAIASLNKYYTDEDIIKLQKIASQLSLELYNRGMKRAEQRYFKQEQIY